jgi:preprotein translocase subunit SecD
MYAAILRGVILFGCIIIGFQNCTNKSVETHGGLVIKAKFLENNLSEDQKRETIDIIQNRLNDVSESNPTISLDQDNILIEVPEAFDVPLYQFQITQKGDLKITKAYSLPDIYQYFSKADSVNHNYHLSGLLSLNLNDRDLPNDEPIIGFSLISDTAKVISILNSEDIRRVLPDSISFKWDLIPLAGNFPLYASNGDPVMDLSHIDVKSSSGVTALYAKKEFIDLWAKITAEQKGKFLGIIIDDRVLRCPKVNGIVNNGEIIDGLSADQFWRLVSPVLIHGKINHGVSILEIKQTEKNR